MTMDGTITESVTTSCAHCGEQVEVDVQRISFGGLNLRQPTPVAHCNAECRQAATETIARLAVEREANLQRAAEVRREQRIAEALSLAWPKYRNATAAMLVPDLAGLPTDASILLAGPAGTGKTFQAWAWWQRWAGGTESRASRRPQFHTAADLMEMLRRSFSGDPVVFTDDLLVIDDLGAEKGTEWVVEQLYRIIDYRYRMCLPLVVTTNLSGRDIRDRFGDRILSRLVEACTPIKLAGADKRSGALEARKGVK